MYTLYTYIIDIHISIYISNRHVLWWVRTCYSTYIPCCIHKRPGRRPWPWTRRCVGPVPQDARNLRSPCEKRWTLMKKHGKLGISIPAERGKWWKIMEISSCPDGILCILMLRGSNRNSACEEKMLLVMKHGDARTMMTMMCVYRVTTRKW